MAQRSLGQLQSKGADIEPRRNAQTCADDWEVAEGKEARKAWFYPDLPWGVPSDAETAEEAAARRAGRQFLKVWDGITALACVYVGLAIPFIIGFEELYLKDNTCLWSTLLEEAPGVPQVFKMVPVVDILVDLIFWIDIGIMFVTAQWKLQPFPFFHWSLIDKLPDIRWNYVRGMFLIDFTASLPTQYLDCIDSIYVPGIKLIRLFRLFKLFRLHRIKIVIEALHKHFPQSVYLTTSLEIIIYFVLACHWSGCLFFWVSYSFPDARDPNGWVIKTMFDTETEEILPYHNAWVISMYWSVTTMSTIGYGDISPSTDPERVVGMFLMILGCGFFAFFTGKVTTVLTTKSMPEARFEEMMQEIDLFMTTKQLPRGLKLKVMDFYKIKYPNRRMFEEDVLLDKLENEGLRREVILNIFMDIVSTVPLFRMCELELQKEICLQLTSLYRTRGSVLCRAGDEPIEMYIIRHGLVNVYGRNGVKGTVGDGQMFGEMALMGLSPNGRRLRTAETITLCELCKLTRESFEHLLTTNKNFLNVVRHTVTLHVENLREVQIAVAQGDAQEHELFWESYYFMDWDRIMLQEKALRQKTESRRMNGTFRDNVLIKRMEKDLGKKIFRTLVKMHFAEFQEIGSNRISVGPEHQLIVVVSWKGDAKIPQSGGKNETEAFFLQPMGVGRAGVFREVDLPLLSDSRTPLQDLPPLQVRILVKDGKGISESLQRQTSESLIKLGRSSSALGSVAKHQLDHSSSSTAFKRTKERLQALKKQRNFSLRDSIKGSIKGSFKFSQAYLMSELGFVKGRECDSEEENETDLIMSDPNRSSLYPDARCLWEGQIDMADIIKYRTSCLTLEGQQTFSVILHSTKDKNTTASLSVLASVKRVMTCPAWGRVMAQLNVKGSNSYFMQRQSGLCKGVETQMKHFLNKMTEESSKRRLGELRASFQQFSDLALDKNAHTHEQTAGLAQQQSHSHEDKSAASTIEGAQSHLKDQLDKQQQLLDMLVQQQAQQHQLQEALSRQLQRQQEQQEKQQQQLQEALISHIDIKFQHLREGTLVHAEGTANGTTTTSASHERTDPQQRLEARTRTASATSQSMPDFQPQRKLPPAPVDLPITLPQTPDNAAGSAHGHVYGIYGSAVHLEAHPTEQNSQWNYMA